MSASTHRSHRLDHQLSQHLCMRHRALGLADDRTDAGFAAQSIPQLVSNGRRRIFPGGFSGTSGANAKALRRLRPWPARIFGPAPPPMTPMTLHPKCWPLVFSIACSVNLCKCAVWKQKQIFGACKTLPRGQRMRRPPTRRDARDATPERGDNRDTD